MAVAGKVAITPQGEWDSTVLYDKLSLVTHENAIYIAKKQSQGVVPVDGEYWMFCMQNANTADIQNIVNGTTVVGKATNDSDGNKISETYMKKILELSETDISDETELVSYEEETPKKRTSVKMWEYIKGKIDSVLGIKGISNNVVTTESGYALDATQLNATVEGSYAKGVANEIASINADLSIIKYNQVTTFPYNGITDILKFPVGAYRCSNDKIWTQFENIPDEYASILIVSTTTSPWLTLDDSYCYRQYEVSNYLGKRYFRTLCTGSTAGVIVDDTGWQRAVFESEIKTVGLSKIWSPSCTITTTTASAGLALLVTIQQIFVLHTSARSISYLQTGGDNVIFPLEFTINGLTLTITSTKGNRNLYGLFPIIGDWTLG